MKLPKQLLLDSPELGIPGVEQKVTQSIAIRMWKLWHSWWKAICQSHSTTIPSKALKKRDANIYPPYYRLLIARKSCYPADEFVVISETEIKIKLQHLLDLTAERIIEVNEGKLINLTDAEFLYMEMTVEYGISHPFGNPEYNQIFENDDGTKTEASIFMSSLVSIRAASKQHVLFQNPRPSSTLKHFRKTRNLCSLLLISGKKNKLNLKKATICIHAYNTEYITEYKKKLDF